MTVKTVGPLYEIKDLVCSYGDHPVLRIDELTVASDGPTAFVGHNGSGKTTLFKALAFLMKPVAGTLRFQGAPVENREGELRKEATLLLQEPYLLKRSVFENVAYGLRARGEKENIRERVEEALEMVGLPVEFARREWYRLSGGEARRVALASRLVLRTRVLLLDEPTANVDEENARLMGRVIKEIWEKWGAVTLIASHDIQWLDGICRRRVSMRRGRIEGITD